MEFIPVLGRSVPEDAYNQIVDLYLRGRSIDSIVKEIVKISEVSTDFVVDGMVREILRREIDDLDRKMIPKPEEMQDKEPCDPVKANKMATRAWEDAAIEVAMGQMKLDRVETQVSVLLAANDPTDERKAKITPINPKNIEIGPLLNDVLEQQSEVEAELETAKMLLELRLLGLNH